MILQNGILTNYLPGLMSGIAVVLTGHPVDTVKVISQTTQISPRNVFLEIVKKDGFLGLYRGIGLQVARPILFSSVLFGSYSSLRDALLVQNFIDPHPTQTCSNCLSFRAGAIAGLLSSPIVAIVATPLELIKCRQQVYKLPVQQVLKSIITTSGFCGLYRGFLATTLRSTFNWSYFGTYEYMRRKGNSLLTGASSGLIFWTLCYPFDYVKSHRQTTSQSYSEILGKIRSRGSIFQVYRGYSTTLIRAIPVNIAAISTFEYFHTLLNC
jgi:solute carrier family 25 carnitine/acylcarnitine transporter 20/29